MELGIKYEQNTIVNSNDTARHIGSGTLDVYATPAMIAFIENTCMNAVSKYLNEEECTVGTHIDVEHCAASPVGMNIKCICELIEVDRRKLVFDAIVYDDKGKIAYARHERFIVNSQKFIKKANEKLL